MIPVLCEITRVHVDVLKSWGPVVMKGMGEAGMRLGKVALQAGRSGGSW